MRTPADRGEGGMKRGNFLRMSFMDDPIVVVVVVTKMIADAGDNKMVTM